MHWDISFHSPLSLGLGLMFLLVHSEDHTGSTAALVFSTQKAKTDLLGRNYQLYR